MKFLKITQVSENTLKSRKITMNKLRKKGNPIFWHRKISSETFGDNFNTIADSVEEKRIQVLLPIKHFFSHNGNKKFFYFHRNTLNIRFIAFHFFIGMLYAILPVPVLKRKIEMENFEGKVNYNLLHTYLYVSYLDTVNEVNKLELSNQKNSYLKQLCFNTSFSDILCLNLICNNEELIDS